jgi:hypothetical protein
MASRVRHGARNRALACVVLTITLGAGAWPAIAQGTVGTIIGTVLDSNGGPLPGATVTVTSSRTKEARTTVTDAAGTYAVPGLAAGSYQVEVQLSGFNRLVRSDVPVAADAPTRVDATLQIAVSEELVVTARRRAERLQDTPVAISPFTAATLEARQVQQTQDLEGITPSLQF